MKNAMPAKVTMKRSFSAMELCNEDRDECSNVVTSAKGGDIDDICESSFDCLTRQLQGKTSGLS